MNDLTQERLKLFFFYCPLTGEFARIRTRSGKATYQLMSRASDGYIQATIDGKTHAVHRLAFLYMSGEFPPNLVDHINGNKSDNRFQNLRMATLAQNNANTTTPRGPSGILGVSWNKWHRKWCAQIKSQGKNKTIGYYDAPEDAEIAYKAAKQAILAAIFQTTQEAGNV